MSAYAKGARVEREAKALLESLGLPVFRVAGSHGVDLVIPKLAVEVKFRTTLPPTLTTALARPLISTRGNWAISVDHLLFYYLFEPQQVKSIPLESLTPKNGFLLVRAPRKPWIVIAPAHIIHILQEEVSCARVSKMAK